MKKKGGGIKDADIYASQVRPQSFKKDSYRFRNNTSKINEDNTGEIFIKVLIGILLFIGFYLLVTKIFKKKTYECTNGKCKEFDSNVNKNKKRGDYDTLDDCNKKCSLPRFSCTTDDRCIEDVNGNYSTLNDCEEECDDNNNNNN